MRISVGYRDRTFCEILEEMRKSYKTLNFGHLSGLIEELQTVGNRMEAALTQKADLAEWDADWTKMRTRVKKLKAEVKRLENLREQLGGKKAE